MLTKWSVGQSVLARYGRQSIDSKETGVLSNLRGPSKHTNAIIHELELLISVIWLFNSPVKGSLKGVPKV